MAAGIPEQALGCCIPGEREELCWGRDAAASPRNWLYLQIRVENPDEGADLGIAGTLQDDESSRSVLTPAGESQEGQAEPGWNSGWDSLWLWDAPHGAEPGSEGQSPVGQEQMLGAREGVCLGSRHTSQHGRAAFPQVPWQQRCQGRRWSSSSASGSCQLFPMGIFHQAQPWVQTRGPRKLCVLRTGLALVTAAPRSFPAPSDPSPRRELCTHSPNTDFPSPSLFRTRYFCCVRLFKDFSRP